MEQGRFRIGLRVDNVAAAARFYQGLGSFDVLGEVPGPDGHPVMVILEREGALLIVDALEGMPFPDNDRERQIRSGPRGLGVAVGLGVDDLDATYRYCADNGCEITCEPREEVYGDRVFEMLDPYGYQWEISCPVADIPADQALKAVRGMVRARIVRRSATLRMNDPINTVLTAPTCVIRLLGGTPADALTIGRRERFQ